MYVRQPDFTLYCGCTDAPGGQLDLLADHDIEELPQYAPLKYSNGGDTDPIGGECHPTLAITQQSFDSVCR